MIVTELRSSKFSCSKSYVFYPVCPTNWNNILIKYWFLYSRLNKHYSNTESCVRKINDEMTFIVQTEKQKGKIIINDHQCKIHESALQMNDRYVRFAYIFQSTRHTSIMELNLIGRLLRRSDTVCRHVFTLLLQ